MCLCNDNDYYGRDGRHPQNPEKDRRQVAAQGYGWPGQTTTRSNNPQQSLRRKDSYIEPGLAHALVGLPDSDFRAVYDPERARQHRVLARQPMFSPNYPQQRQGAHGIVAQQPHTMEAMAMAYPQGVPHIAYQHPGIFVSSKTAQSQPSPARLMRRDSNGVSEFGSDDEYDASALRNYTVSPITTKSSSAPKMRTKPSARNSNRHDYGWI
ncbi:hypothetical protein K449DRAFT_404101 [Hypoxylon sp. EC38]|nr:hypothetical protein K449DRAFT_404101 [Hypoxylon sp. EC38]